MFLGWFIAFYVLKLQQNTRCLEVNLGKREFDALESTAQCVKKNGQWWVNLLTFPSRRPTFILILSAKNEKTLPGGSKNTTSRAGGGMVFTFQRVSEDPFLWALAQRTVRLVRQTIFMSYMMDTNSCKIRTLAHQLSNTIKIFQK